VVVEVVESVSPIEEISSLGSLQPDTASRIAANETAAMPRRDRTLEALTKFIPWL
jgi:hypothetical protein